MQLTCVPVYFRRGVPVSQEIQLKGRVHGLFGAERHLRRLDTHITLECARFVDGKEEDDVPTGCESPSKDITVLGLRGP